MPLILIRHASAGDRAEWDGSDLARPLDDRGRAEAEGLVTRLAAFRVDSIYSSPAVRCVQTIAPLAATRRLPVIACDALAEARQAVDGGPLLRELAAQDVVVCGHGGLEQVLAEPQMWRKGAAFVLDSQLRIVREV
ncbi:MAG TPA: phosphoglycerate mutase family protein [Gaiellaceae bacterium]|nr:phosphoglycerate mutase family protein [Gaiellaceae bacterium]